MPPRAFRPRLVSPPGLGKDDDLITFDEIICRLEALRGRLSADQLEELRRLALPEVYGEVQSPAHGAGAK